MKLFSTSSCTKTNRNQFPFLWKRAQKRGMPLRPWSAVFFGFASRTFALSFASSWNGPAWRGGAAGPGAVLRQHAGVGRGLPARLPADGQRRRWSSASPRLLPHRRSVCGPWRAGLRQNQWERVCHAHQWRRKRSQSAGQAEWAWFSKLLSSSESRADLLLISLQSLWSVRRRLKQWAVEMMRSFCSLRRAQFTALTSLKLFTCPGEENPIQEGFRG